MANRMEEEDDMNRMEEEDDMNRMEEEDDMKALFLVYFKLLHSK